MKKLFVLLSWLIITTATPTYALINSNQLEERFENRLENREQKRAEFQEKIKALKDQNKAKIVERINNQLALFNQKATESAEKHLNSIQELLNKTTEWKDKAKAASKDVTIAETAIASTQTAINNAVTANEAQKLKIYTITFTDESGLRVGASAAKTELRNDLQSIREKIKTTRQQLIEAIKTVKAII